ncbi:MAG TPA: endopeptidase La, partial [Acidobacteriota bacterium]|nr:endopeptidase La [Acidobacteriota bacterium]
MTDQETNGIKILPILPLKNNVLFPHALMPLSVGRASSLAAVEAALASEEKEILVVAQRDPAVENPTQDDLYTVGTTAVIKRMQRPQPDLLHLVVQGVERSVLLKVEQTEPYLRGRVRLRPVTTEKSAEIEALYRAVLDLVNRAIMATQPEGGLNISNLIGESDDPLRLVYLVAAMLSLDVKKEQSLLEADQLVDALRLMHEYLTFEVQVMELRSNIASKAQSEMTKQQREYFLRQQLQAIKKELGEDDPETAEVNLLRERLEKAELPEQVRKEAERELDRLEKLPSVSPEYNVIRTYLDLILELPWSTSSEERLDLAFARKVLDEDHYDLEEIKERILEHLGVLKLNPQAKAPILCFVGPPGVGKTSLGQSIARALGRRFERMSLGGLHDEAELRGHRRTYIGAIPGRIIQAIRRAGVNNPVLMLDEVDKIGRDFRGDPAAALLEILDPEQNREFRDNYLDLPFDLSKTFFITTANTLDTIPLPLLDRMEVLRLSGYSEEEKLQIARRYLIPRQIRETGLSLEQLEITDEALKQVISRYTREAGVRQLERAIGRLARKVALQFAEGRTEPFRVEPEHLTDLLGSPRFFPEETRKDLEPGVAIGLAWTESGGDVLFIEATLLPEGKGLILTGQLGDVMRESAQAAQSYIWAHADSLGIDADLFKKAGVHIHVPAGAIPKDGP